RASGPYYPSGLPTNEAPAGQPGGAAFPLPRLASRDRPRYPVHTLYDDAQHEADLGDGQVQQQAANLVVTDAHGATKRASGLAGGGGWPRPHRKMPPRLPPLLSSAFPAPAPG